MKQCLVDKTDFFENTHLSVVTQNPSIKKGILKDLKNLWETICASVSFLKKLQAGDL